MDKPEPPPNRPLQPWRNPRAEKAMAVVVFVCIIGFLIGMALTNYA